MWSRAEVAARIARPLDDAERELLGEIARRPAEDGPRAVYADWLGERGDPRGELISLQLRRGDRPGLEDRRPEPSQRELALYMDYGPEWFGPWLEAVAPNAVNAPSPMPRGLARRFVRGFLHERPLLGTELDDWEREARPRLTAGERARLLRLGLGYYLVDLEHPDWARVGGLHCVYRATSLDASATTADSDAEPVAVKVTTVKGRSQSWFGNERLLDQEREVLRSCAAAPVARPRGLARVGARAASVLEWIEGVDLDVLRPRCAADAWPQSLVVALGARLFVALSRLHRALAQVRGRPEGWGPARWGTLDRHVRLAADGALHLLDLTGACEARWELESSFGEWGGDQAWRPPAAAPPPARRGRPSGWPMERPPEAEEDPRSTRPPISSPASDVFAAALVLAGCALGVPLLRPSPANPWRYDLDDADRRLESLGAVGALLAEALRQRPAERPGAAELARAFVALDSVEGAAELDARAARASAS